MAKRTRKLKRLSAPKLGLLIAEACKLAEQLLPDEDGETKRKWVVGILNKKLDIPLLNEKQEEAVLGIIIDVTCDLVFSRPSKNTGSLEGDREVASKLLAALRA